MRSQTLVVAQGLGVVAALTAAGVRGATTALAAVKVAGMEVVGAHGFGEVGDAVDTVEVVVLLTFVSMGFVVMDEMYIYLGVGAVDLRPAGIDGVVALMDSVVVVGSTRNGEI